MFATKIKTYFFDADPAGIIFFGNLFKYLHVAYEDFMKSLNMKRNFFFDDNYVLPILHAEADYFLPLKVGDELKIEVHVSKIKKSSFELSYKVYKNKNEIAAAAKTVHVCVSKNNFNKSELPKELYDKLKNHLQENY
ncbi:MAG: thioesterase family protein [Melioribacteraceae bacterium]